MEQSAKRKGKFKSGLRYYVAILLLIILIAVSLIVGIPEYKKKIAQAEEIEKQKQEKLAELAELEAQYKTLDGKINFTDSQEYLLRYAREYLGYMLPGDIRIDVDNPEAPVPTAQLPLVTAQPMPTASTEEETPVPSAQPMTTASTEEETVAPTAEPEE